MVECLAANTGWRLSSACLAQQRYSKTETWSKSTEHEAPCGVSQPVQIRPMKQGRRRRRPPGNQICHRDFRRGDSVAVSPLILSSIRLWNEKRDASWSGWSNQATVGTVHAD